MKIHKDSDLGKVILEKLAMQDFKMDALLDAIINASPKPKTPQNILRNVDPESLFSRFQQLSRNLEELNRLMTWQELLPILDSDYHIKISISALRKLKNNHVIDSSNDDTSYLISKEDLEALLKATSTILGDLK